MSSKYFYVSWDVKNKVWVARVTRGKRHGGDGTQKYLGSYDDERSAALAVDAFIRENTPGLRLAAKLNFPDMDPRDLARELAQAIDSQRRKRHESKRRTGIRSRFLGVSWCAGSDMWHAKMRHSKHHGGDGKNKFIGYYYDEWSAALAVDGFIRENMPGLVGKLNFPDMDPRDLARDLAQVEERMKRRSRSRPGTAVTSDYLGVSWDLEHEVWKAKMRHSTKHGGDGQARHLGRWDDERSAALAVDAFIREHMPGLVGKLNFPDMDPREFAREFAQVKRRRRGAAAPPPSRKRPRSSPAVVETATRPRLLDQPIPTTREERMLAIAASPTASALFRLVTRSRPRREQARS